MNIQQLAEALTNGLPNRDELIANITRAEGKTFNAGQYGIVNDGVTDSQSALRTLFLSLASVSGPKTVIIPPGQYALGAGTSIAVPNDLTVIATGAEFTYPTAIPGGAASIFTGTDVQNFSWTGGKFTGYAFDPFKAGGYATNVWTPIQGVRTFFFTTATLGCAHLRFRNIESVDTGLEVINVKGKATGTPAVTFALDNESAETTAIYSDDIVVENCNFRNSGQRLWDYGWLWQICMRESQYTADLRAMANQYLLSSSNIGTFTWANGSQDVVFDNTGPKIPLGTVDTPAQILTFGGPDGILPSNVIRAAKYYCVFSDSTKIRVSATHLGGAVTAGSAAGAGARIIYNMVNGFSNMLMPTGASDQGRGSFTFIDCSNVKVVGTTWSAPGDSMVALRCRKVLMSGNALTDAKMGGVFCNKCAFFEVTGNMIDGGNGSHMISIENTTDSVLSGNVIAGGGRGALWIACTRAVVCNNAWFDNTTKNENDYARGRLTYDTAGFPAWTAEYPMQLQGTNSDFTITGNTFHTNVINAATTLFFNGNCSRLVCKDNVFSGDKLNVKKLPGTTISEVTIGDNKGGMYGYKEGQYTASLGSVASVTIPHGIPANTIQDADGITWIGNARGANAASVGVTYVTADSTNVVVNFSPNISGTVLINWSVQAVML